MRAVDIIEKKKRGLALTDGEIGWFVEGFASGRIPDYQAAAWLMAVWFSGMDARETAALTVAMARSGDSMDLSVLPGVKVDKHSTGGVGDTATLVAAPLVAACGVRVAKMSGRGLGHTGGTLDKLESIPGLQTAQTPERFFEIVGKAGFAIVGQSASLAPADKKLYALRDVTATVDSLPLIAASVMSKKLAAGCDAIVLDVKTGSGAFMGDRQGATALARAMVDLGRAAGRRTVAFITDMSQPLGRAVGNGLEVAEALDILSGRLREGRLRRLAVELGAEMLVLGGRASDRDRGREMMLEALENGEGLRRFRLMVEEMGGDAAAVDDPERLYAAASAVEVRSGSGGWFASMDVREAGRAAQMLGAGRETKDGAIDPAVGFVMLKELGDRVEEGEPVARFYVNNKARAAEAMRVFIASVIISQEPVRPPELILEYLK